MSKNSAKKRQNQIPASVVPATKPLSLADLKVMAYDAMVQVKNWTARAGALNDEIAKREQAVPVQGPEPPAAPAEPTLQTPNS